MSPAALGLRAMPSTAALTALPWPSAPNAAANASAKPAVMIDHCATIPAVAAAAPVSCANAGDEDASRQNQCHRQKRLLHV